MRSWKGVVTRCSARKRFEFVLDGFTLGVNLEGTLLTSSARSWGRHGGSLGDTIGEDGGEMNECEQETLGSSDDVSQGGAGDTGISVIHAFCR